jgi:ribose 5-phosphate isomerase A
METQAVDLRRIAAESALQFVQDGMALGIGTGRTAGYFIDFLGERYQSGELKGILAVPTSEASAERLRSHGIPITSLTQNPVLDLAVDGADEIDPDLNLIKGLGRALLREKIVEIRARRFLIVADESKVVERLGTTGPLPVEISPFQALSHVQWLDSLCSRADLVYEPDSSPAVTVNGNYLAHCWFDLGIPDPCELNRVLNDRPGILEHGLFLGMATHAVVAGETGVRLLECKHGG